jgi:hypothetical protein
MKKLLVILLVLGMVAPAMAAEWDFYGSARVKAFYYNFDDKASDVQDENGDFESDTDLSMGLQGNARIGANVKASDEVSGRFEYGASGGNANIRLLYGVYNFGAGSLLVGQDYTPIDTLYSNQVVEDDNGLLYEGCAYEGRIAQLKLQMGGFQVALVGNNASGVDDDTDVVIPKIELAYDMNMDTMSVGGFAGYQTYKTGAAGVDHDVTSYLVGVRAKINLGPAYINAAAHYGQNLGNYGILMRNDYAGYQAAAGSDTEDATSYAAALVAGAKFSDMVAIEAGVGYMKNEVDTVGAGSVTQEGDAMTYYVQAPITLAPGVFIVPEISIFDLGDSDNGVSGGKIDNGQVTTYGAKFQINF